MSYPLFFLITLFKVWYRKPDVWKLFQQYFSPKWRVKFYSLHQFWHCKLVHQMEFHPFLTGDILLQVLDLTMSVQNLRLLIFVLNGKVQLWTLTFLSPTLNYKIYWKNYRYSNKYKFKHPVQNIRVDGTCCLKIYEKYRFRGDSEILYPGHNGGYDLWKIGSYRFFNC